jgi:hypothetical protein
MTPLHKRVCGPCNTCCVELEIDAPELRKKARAPCQHLAGAGCGIYAKRRTRLSAVPLRLAAVR